MSEILLIIFLQLIYVPLLTLRTIFMVKNINYMASIFGFLECLVYVFGLGIVLRGNQTLWGLLVYAIGYGAGIFIGGCVEQRLALGYTAFEVNLMNKDEALIADLRENGFGVAVFQGEGRDGKRYNLEIMTKRNREKELLQLIENYDPKAFIVTYEPRKFKLRKNLLFK